MAVFFRAMVMLVTLVGLPATWIYYGPLPGGAQKVVDRFVEVAKDSLGWSRISTEKSTGDPDKVAPLFNKALIRQQHLEPAEALHDQPTGAIVSPPSSPISLASANLAANTSKEQYAKSLADELKPHFLLLRELGAADYTLSRWGTEGNLYRFRCSVPFQENASMSREFDAIESDPVDAVRIVVGEVSSWQNALLDAKDSGRTWR